MKQRLATWMMAGNGQWQADLAAGLHKAVPNKPRKKRGKG